MAVARLAGRHIPTNSVKTPLATRFAKPVRFPDLVLRSTRMYRHSGLTLIELLITVTLITILSISSVPAFTNLVMEMRMTSQVNGFVHAFHLAKQASQQLFSEIVLCKSPDGVQCDAGNTWADGWIAFVNVDKGHPPRVDQGERILAVGDSFKTGTITGNRQHFVFRPFALRSTNGTLTFCDRRGPDQARAVVVSYTGRPRVVRGIADDTSTGPSPVCPS
jgi:type IV fimbrial biogenesis protein FimT